MPLLLSTRQQPTRRPRSLQLQRMKQQHCTARCVDVILGWDSDSAAGSYLIIDVLCRVDPRVEGSGAFLAAGNRVY
jgi:hypothetical protein